METLTQETFNLIWDKLNKENKDVTETDWDWCLKQITAYTGGTVKHSHTYSDEHEVHFAIIKDCTHRITNDQLCDIFDEGNHCVSVGAITYEVDSDGCQLAYLHWSNLGHI